ncbi:hypothetical protein PHSC3_001175 [Chlamydiales bacterium STE3]|nr:hypothetical protein PHSC3_001175 [Chlamydiales bacterium STE3]
MQIPPSSIPSGQKIQDFNKELGKVQQQKLTMESSIKYIVLKALGFSNNLSEVSKINSQVNAFVSQKEVLNQHTKDLIQFIKDNPDLSKTDLENLKKQRAGLNSAVLGLKTLADPMEVEHFSNTVQALNTLISQQEGKIDQMQQQRVRTTPKPLVAPDANANKPPLPPGNTPPPLPARPHQSKGVPTGPFPSAYGPIPIPPRPNLPLQSQNNLEKGTRTPPNKPLPLTPKQLAFIDNQMKEISTTEKTFLEGIDIAIVMFSSLEKTTYLNGYSASEETKKMLNQIQPKLPPLISDLKEVRQIAQKIQSAIEETEKETDPLKKEEKIAEIYTSDEFKKYTASQAKLLKNIQENRFKKLLEERYGTRGFNLKTTEIIKFDDAWNKGNLIIFAQRLPRHKMFAKAMETRHKKAYEAVEHQGEILNKSAPAASLAKRKRFFFF